MYRDCLQVLAASHCRENDLSTIGRSSYSVGPTHMKRWTVVHWKNHLSLSSMNMFFREREKTSLHCFKLVLEFSESQQKAETSEDSTFDNVPS